MTTRLIYCILLICFSNICTTAYAAKCKAKHVVLIGFDGWGSYSVEQAEMPIVKELMESGSYTLRKRSVLPSSSAVNWASMFMGAGPELHGFTTWGSKSPDLPSRELTHYGLFPSIWGLFRDANPKAEVGYIYQWDGFEYFAEMPAMSYTCHGKSDTLIAQKAVDYIIEKKPVFLGVFFDEPDHVGHQIGHDTEAYYKKMNQLDGFLAGIINALKEAKIWDDTILIVTSDHGGIEKGHGGKTMAEMETPFIIAGKGIKKGYVIEDSMMQFDVAPTIAHIFGLKTPQVWIGRPMKNAFK